MPPDTANRNVARVGVDRSQSNNRNSTDDREGRYMEEKIQFPRSKTKTTSTTTSMGKPLKTFGEHEFCSYSPCHSLLGEQPTASLFLSFPFCQQRTPEQYQIVRIFFY